MARLADGSPMTAVHPAAEVSTAAPVQWTRRAVIGAVIGRSVLEGLAVIVLVAIGLGALGRLPAELPTALVAGPLVVVLRLSSSLASNALPRRYLERWATGSALGTTSIDLERARPVALDMARAGLNPVLTTTTPGGDLVHDVFQSSNRLVTVTVGVASGEATFISQLSDGRLLVTASRPLVPHQSLVVGVAAADGLVDAHRQNMERVVARNLRPRPADPGVAIALTEIERSSFDALGSLVGPFLDLGPEGRRRSPQSIGRRLSAQELWAWGERFDRNGRNDSALRTHDGRPNADRVSTTKAGAAMASATYTHTAPSARSSIG